MKVYLKGRDNNYYGEGNWENGQITVLKGSKTTIKHQENFKFTNAVISAWNDTTVVNQEGYVLKDVSFSSPSSAAQFLTGQSINGWAKWKTESGLKLKEI